MIGVFLWYTLALSQISSVVLQNSCENQKTCKDCIGDTSVCVWCADDDFAGTRCIPTDILKSGWCSEIINPNSTVVVPESSKRDFSSGTGNYVQIKPQSYNMALRPGKTEKFTFAFQGSRNYPVDVYFLIDASDTMTHYYREIARSSEKIYNTFKSLTENVYMGIGTFIDKNLLPFSRSVDTLDVYSFRHQLSLNNDFKVFRNVVSNISSAENRDKPEGGLDALAQVLVCDDIIGWRNDSRKIVVFLTDSTSHVEGDGKGVGIFEHYDGKCHTKENIYMMEKELDYPSPGMINKLASKKEVTIIFAVTHPIKGFYNELSKTIRRSKSANIEGEGDAIAKILTKIYEDISKSIKLKVEIEPSLRNSFNITISPDCVYSYTQLMCKSKPGQEHFFEGTINIKDKIDATSTSISIMVEGIIEKLVLNVSVIKECECRNIELNSEYCNNGGNRQCGICLCNPKRYGPTCACEENRNNLMSNLTTCSDKGSTEECNSHGICICGICRCDPGFECTYCESRTKSCGNNGHSECGMCVCDRGFFGNDCNCNEEHCLDKSKKKCNNRGDCKCNRCECKKTANWDKRLEHDRFCAMIPDPNRNEEQCRALEPCVLCKLGSDNCPSQCTPEMNVQLVDTLKTEKLSSSWVKCNKVRVKAGCSTTFLFMYNDDEYGITVMVQKSIDCAENYYWIGGILLVLLLLCGIGALIGWKIVTTKRDKREYQEFVSKNKSEISDMISNPLFIPPCVEINNPGFRKRSVR